MVLPCKLTAFPSRRSARILSAGMASSEMGTQPTAEGAGLGARGGREGREGPDPGVPGFGVVGRAVAAQVTTDCATRGETSTARANKGPMSRRRIIVFLERVVTRGRL